MTSGTPPAVVCGNVATAGSFPHVTAVLAAPDRRYALTGKPSAELIGYEGPICVTGEPIDAGPPYRYGIVVTTYRLRGDGRHAPIVGTIEVKRGRYTLVDGAGRRFTLRGDTTQLNSVAGGKAYVWGLWRDGAIDVERYGPLDAAVRPRSDEP